MLEKKDDLIKNPRGGVLYENARQNNYDLLRILSTCAVILIHVNWKFFREIYQIHDANFYYSFESLLNILTRFSVPCFVMISGGFLLDTNKTSSYIGFYKQSFKKIFIPTIIAIVIQFSLYFICNINSKGKLFSGIINLINGNFNSLWYMYMLFPVYIMVPAIKILKSVLSKSAYCRISIILSVWSIISQATSSQKLSYSIGVTIAFLSYLILGDIIKNELCMFFERLNVKMLIPVMFLCIVTSFFFRFYVSDYYVSNAYTSFFSPTIFCYSVLMFVVFSKCSIKYKLDYLSKITFYMYLFHMICLNFWYNIAEQFEVDQVLKIFVLELLTILSSYVVANLYKYFIEIIYKKTRIIKFVDSFKL